MVRCILYVYCYQQLKMSLTAARSQYEPQGPSLPVCRVLVMPNVPCAIRPVTRCGSIVLIHSVGLSSWVSWCAVRGPPIVLGRRAPGSHDCVTRRGGGRPLSPVRVGPVTGGWATPVSQLSRSVGDAGRILGATTLFQYLFCRCHHGDRAVGGERHPQNQRVVKKEQFVFGRIVYSVQGGPSIVDICWVGTAQGGSPGGANNPHPGARERPAPPLTCERPRKQPERPSLLVPRAALRVPEDLRGSLLQ